MIKSVRTRVRHAELWAAALTHRRHSLIVIAVLLITLQLALRSWWVGHSWFFVDDYLFLSDIARGRDDAAWYFRIHQGHFMPLSFVLVKLVGSFGAFNWTLATVQIITLQLIASGSCFWMLRTVFGPRLMILLPFAFYLFSPLTMPSVMWWAVAINQLPHHIAVFGAIALHIQYLRSRKWRYVFGASAFLAIGFMAYTKTLLLPGVLVLLTVIYFARGSLPRRSAEAFIRYWHAWACYSAVTAVWLVIYSNSRPPSDSTSFWQFITLTGSSILESFATALVGGPWRWLLFGDPISYSAAPTAGVVLAWLFIVSALSFTWTQNQRALRALWLVAFYIAASVISIAIGRGFVLGLIGGAQVGRHMQYLSDSAPIVALTIGLLSMPILGASEYLTRRSSPLLVWKPSGLVIGLIASLIILGSLYSSQQFAKPWNSNFPSRAFTTASIAEIRASDPIFAEAPVPEAVFSPVFAPRNLIGNYFAPLGDTVRTTTVGNDLKLLDVNGRIVDAELDGPVRTSRAGDCPYEVAKFPRTIPITPVVDFPFWVAIDYSSNISGSIPFDVGIFRKNMPIEAGTHTLFFPTVGAYDAVRLRPLVGQRICIKSVKVGQLLPEIRP